jgi:uncharacterized protein YkwD
VTATAAEVLRRGLTLRLAGLAALAVALSLVAVGSAAGLSSGSVLVSTTACNGSDDPRASQAVQRKAIACLVNVARRQAGISLLATPPKLGRASVLKGRGVVSCAQLTHTPCGAEPTAAIRAAGYSYGWFGENLWFGTWGAFSARQVVESWLSSPGHRANILRSNFRHLGVARVRARGVFGEASTAVWVATFASPG